MGFDLRKVNGYSRIGELNINGRKLETPYLYPVLNFYCGGLWASKFGGGIYRNLKEEFLMNPHYSTYFSGVLTSVSHLIDFQINAKKLDAIYLSKTIHDWFDYKGILFVDSGGFKLFKEGSIKNSKLSFDATPDGILKYQEKFGADIIVSLDYPIFPEISADEKRKRIEFSLQNAATLLKKQPKNKLLYVALHGYSEEDLVLYINSLFKLMDKEHISRKPDGIALGSLVPLKNNYSMLLTVVSSARKVLKQNGLDHLPIHVFGISSNMLPILTLLGVDTFDSTSYIHAAINGVYLTDGLARKKIEKVVDSAGFKKCDCPICRNEEYVSRMSGKTNSARDRIAPLAMHNLIQQKKELEVMKSYMAEGSDELKAFITKRYSTNKGLLKLIHQCNQP